MQLQLALDDVSSSEAIVLVEKSKDDVDVRQTKDLAQTAKDLDESIRS